MVELLSPVGDMECLKAAVQNGADAVYFGGLGFNARAGASNFDKDAIREAIRYAKLRNVKINFTLNTLLKNDEFEEAAELAKYVYEEGADAIIVQDLGLAKYLIKNFPDMEIHGSTQMSIHNLSGVKELEALGFNRVVLSRELSMHDIEYICQNSDIEIEVFVHGALCVSYSGQCLMSSIIGGRSGNRGKCAQACRLPYELYKESKETKIKDLKDLSSEDGKDELIDKGYLLSPKDLCGLKYIPQLLKAGVKSFKIEGRLKPPEYVATVTKIYRKYIDLAMTTEPYVIDDKDITELLQVFNRGGFSEGNFNNEPNTSYVYTEKPNNMGICVGNVKRFNKNKGLITLKTNIPLKIGDNISTELENHKYTISELMNEKEENIKEANPGDTIIIGRMKGNINSGDKIFKLSSVTKNKHIKEQINKENVKIPLIANVEVKKNKPISMRVVSRDTEDGAYFSMISEVKSEIEPIDAISNPISEERIYEQINKTTDTQFWFAQINIDMDKDLYIPKISAINALRRKCLEELERKAIRRFTRREDEHDENVDAKINELLNVENNKTYEDAKFRTRFENNVKHVESRKYCLLLNELNLEYNYEDLGKVDNIYVPIKYFMQREYSDILKTLSLKSKLYIYLPTIVKDNFRNLYFNNIVSYIEEYNVKGIIITNLAGAEYKYVENNEGLEIIGNYTLNVFNNHTIEELADLGLDRIMVSPELDKDTLEEVAKHASIPTELMVYGRLPLMNMGYCVLGKANRCYPECDMKCRSGNDYYLKDRIGFKFPVKPDNMQTVTTIYNSKITSLEYSDIDSEYIRISILEENIDEINNIIDKVKKDEIFTGNDYTYGNWRKFV